MAGTTYLSIGVLLISYTGAARFSLCPEKSTSSTIMSVDIHTSSYPNWVREDACHCTLKTTTNTTRFKYALQLEKQVFDSNEACGPLLEVKSTHKQHYMCPYTDTADQRGDVVLGLGDSLTFHLYNPVRRETKATIAVNANVGFKIECGPYIYPSNLTMCPCNDHESIPPGHGALVGETPLKKRLAAGFIAAIAFLVIFGSIMLAHWYYKKRQRKENGTLVKKTDAQTGTGAAVNPAYDQGSERGSQYLYDEVDPVTGRTRIRIEPDPALKLTSQTSSVFGDIQGSKDSGMYSLANRGLSHVNSEISPYASTVSVRTEMSNPPLAGYGIEPPQSAGYQPSTPGYARVGFFNQPAQVQVGYKPQPKENPPTNREPRNEGGYQPAPYTVSNDLDFHVPVGSNVPYDPRLSDLNIEDLYAKPLKGPRSKAAGQQSQPGPPLATEDVDDIDIQIPGPRESKLDTSMASTETEV